MQSLPFPEVARSVSVLITLPLVALNCNRIGRTGAGWPAGELERAGWRFVRIRESEFYAGREGCVRRIVEACQELGIRPIVSFGESACN